MSHCYSVTIVFHFLVVCCCCCCLCYYCLSFSCYYCVSVTFLSVTISFHFLVTIVVSVTIVFHFLVVMFDNVLDMSNMLNMMDRFDYRLGSVMYRLGSVLDMLTCLTCLTTCLNMMDRLGSMTAGGGGMFDRMFSTLVCSICNNWSIDFIALINRIYN